MCAPWNGLLIGENLLAVDDLRATRDSRFVNRELQLVTVSQRGQVKKWLPQPWRGDRRSCGAVVRQEELARTDACRAAVCINGDGHIMPPRWPSAARR